jgi:hypothetical protein
MWFKRDAVLGVRARPLAGRVFLPEEGSPARSHVVLLNNGLKAVPRACLITVLV